MILFRSLLPLAAGLLIHATAWTQSTTERASVDWGPEMEEGDYGSFMDLLHEDDDALYMSIAKKRETFITKYDLNFKQIYQKLLPWEINKDDHANEGIFFVGDRIMVFSSHYSKKEDEKVLYLRVFDKSNMAVVKPLERVFAISADKARNSGSFEVRTSPDNKYVLVSVTKPREKEAREEFELRVYDDQASLAWERKVTMPYQDDEFAIDAVDIDDDGSVMVLGVKYDEKKERKAKAKKGEVYYLYHLLVWKDGTSPMEDTPVDVPGKFLQDMTIATMDDGDIICAGFWGNKNTWTIRGAYYLRMDRSSKRIEHESYNEFTDDFITAYMTEKEEKKATKRAEKKGEDLTMYQFQLDDIVMREDGGAILVGEQAYNYVTCYTDSRGNTRCNTHYIYNDIILVNINPEGNIDWCSKVPKRQHSINDGGYYSSYALAVKGDKLYTVFNDSGKNLMLLQGDKIHQFDLTGKEALITLATVEEGGQTHREALLTPEKREAILRPKSCVQLADDRMFIYAKRKKDFRYGMISFQ